MHASRGVGSAASFERSSRGRSSKKPRRRSQPVMRFSTRSATAAISRRVGAGPSWKASGWSARAKKTPSGTTTCRWTKAPRVALKRWTKVTLPVAPPSMPRSLAFCFCHRAISSTKMRFWAVSASGRRARTWRTSEGTVRTHWRMGFGGAPGRRDEPPSRTSATRCGAHRTEVRVVRYPWHPLHAEQVVVHPHGTGVVRCAPVGDARAKSILMDEWMLDPVACATMRSASEPSVCLDALEDLRRLLVQARDLDPPSASADTAAHEQASRPSASPDESTAPAPSSSGVGNASRSMSRRGDRHSLPDARGARTRSRRSADRRDR